MWKNLKKEKKNMTRLNTCIIFVIVVLNTKILCPSLSHFVAQKFCSIDKQMENGILTLSKAKQHVFKKIFFQIQSTFFFCFQQLLAKNEPFFMTTKNIWS